MALSNLRQNPIDSSISAFSIIDESHTIAEFTELPGVYGFILQERPIAGTVSVRKDNTAETPYTIVLTDPLTSQVFVDFNSDRGYCIFNSDQDGQAIIVTYNGAGANLSVENTRLIADEQIADAGLQDELVSGVNIKTINGSSVLGSGNLSISADVAAAIVAAASKSTPVGADSIGIVDSAASNVLKETTFTEMTTNWFGGATAMNILIPLMHPHGIFNTKFTAVDNSTTEQSMGIDLSTASYNIITAVRKAGSTGDVEWLSSSSAIKITLSTGTVTGTIAGITITGAYDLYAYAISNNGTLIFGLSRSPYHKSVPANYTHTNTASARTLVGSASTAWDQMWISISTTINATNSCVCLGLIGTVTFDGTNGRASVSALSTGALPSWDTVRITNWQPYTQVFVGLGTVSNLNSYFRMTGPDTMLIRGKVTTGTTTAVPLQASLPSGSVIDFNKIATGSIVGRWARNAAASPYFALVNSSDTTNFRISASTSLSEANGNGVAGNTEVQSYNVELPVT